MKYIKINEHGVVIGGGDCPEGGLVSVPIERGQALVPNVASPGYNTVWRYANGALINTEQPITPPQPWMVWSNSSFTWVDPRAQSEIIAAQWQAVRARRNALLAQCDWTQLPDVPLATKSAWASYRQELRDVTLQSNPNTVQWPVEPSVQ